MHIDNANIGNTIRNLRRARNISKAELSRMAGISVSHLENTAARAASGVCCGGKRCRRVSGGQPDRSYIFY